MNIFISGGCKNGKSFYAQQLAKLQSSGNKPLYYIATMEPVDEEDQNRIKRHQLEREGWGFETIVKSRNISSINADFSGSFLLDSITALLSNEMFRRDGTVDKLAHIRISEELEFLTSKCGNIIFVSDNIYSDAMKYEELTELYRKGLAAIDCFLAKKCEVVLEVTYGSIQLLKGANPLV